MPDSPSPAPRPLPGTRGALHPLTGGWLGRLALIIYWLAMLWGTHWPHPPHAPGGVNDKLMHFGAFAGLAFLLAGVWSARRGLSLLIILGVVMVLAAYGAIDELTQPWVGRDCELADWIADMVGVVLGLGTFGLAVLGRRWRDGARSSAVVMRDQSLGNQ